MPRSTHLLRLAKSTALFAGRFTPARPGLTVLLYHRVGAGDRNIDVPLGLFREQMEFLASNTEVVTLADGLARAADPRLEHDLVAVTFDDGTSDLFEFAFPVLAAYGISSTLYLSTGPVEAGLPFPSWATGAVDARALSWSQIDEMAGTGLMSIGSHTHTHADLDRASADVIEDELRRSKDLIEQRLSRACHDFAYPHAVTSDEAERAVARHFSTAAVGGWRKNRPGAVDRYRITRAPVTRADGPIFFRAKVRGRMGAEALMYRIGGTRRG